ncbi:hypothetical protein Droror1_Dr00008552 [Drosera rotundifolia]
MEAEGKGRWSGGGDQRDVGDAAFVDAPFSGVGDQRDVTFAPVADIGGEIELLSDALVFNAASKEVIRNTKYKKAARRMVNREKSTIWRLIKEPSSLAAGVLKTGYFRNDNVLEAGLGHSPSYIWRSLMSVQSLRGSLSCLGCSG